MKPLLHRYSTPLTTGLFLVSAISGIALFFHWRPGTFHEMHEILSLVLLIPVALHLWKNWNGLMGYLRKHTMWLPLAASLALAVPFALGGHGRQGPPPGRGPMARPQGSATADPALRAIPLLTQARLTELAPLLHTAPDALLRELAQRGYRASADDSLDAVAAASGGTSGSELLLSLLPRAR